MQIFPDGTFVLGGIESEDAVMQGARVIPDDSEEALAILAKQGKRRSKQRRIGGKDEKMSKIQIIIDSIAGAVGAVLGFMYGEVTGLFWALIAFMALDYITGVIVAVIEKRLSSEVGFRGLAKKFLILVFVAVGHIADTYILGGTPAAMSAVMLFYIANEGISIIENAAALGLPVPKKLTSIMEQIKNKSESEEK